eukprot:TRINITY_DN9243_c0_g1_i1.p1 TRINITY_DN9243_c0_g1~~TRINITY_DN9243_c0_g1_i1.p1  ORF type:complete len:425 (+),score=57.10 TRINITY_DN9243_c0_g1_i1:55-1275(+)
MYPSPSSISTAANTPEGFFGKLSDDDKGPTSAGCKQASLPLLDDSRHDYESLPFSEYCRLQLGIGRRTAFRLCIITATLAGLFAGLVIRPVMPALRGQQNRIHHAPSEKKAPKELSHSNVTKEPQSLPTQSLPKASAAPTLEGKYGFERFELLGRATWVYRPPMVGLAPRQAVVVLHGSEDSPEGIAEASRFHEVAARSFPGFLVVYPSMATPGGESWDYGAPWEDAFFRALGDFLEKSYSIPKGEVFVAGHSAGGTMALFLQNNMADLFKAAAAVEAGVGHLKSWTNSSSGLPSLVVWNQNDPVLAEFGGAKLLQQTVTQLRRHDEPESGPHEVVPLASGCGGVLSAEKRIWKAKPGKRQPRLSVVAWSSATPTHHWVNNNNLPDAPLDASILIWEFFRDVSQSP